MYCLVQELRGMLAPLTRYHKLTCSSKIPGIRRVQDACSPCGIHCDRNK